MMVCGSIVSSEDLAGATSALKAVPVTTTVSISPAWLLAASCWAWTGTARSALVKRARQATLPLRRVEICDMEGPSRMEGTNDLDGASAYFAKAPDAECARLSPLVRAGGSHGCLSPR